MRLWRARSNHDSETRRKTALFPRLASFAAVLAVVSCLGARPAAAWPRQFGPFAYATADGGVAVVDIATQTKTASIPLGDWSGPIAVTRDGTSIYAGYRKGTAAAVAVIDAGSNAVKARITTTGVPTAILSNATRNAVYVVHKSGAAGAERTGVAVIDVATNALVADIALGRGDFDVRAPRDGDWLLALNKSAGTLVKIDAKTNAIVATIPLGGLARAFDVRPDGLRAFVLRRRDDGVADIVVVNIPDATLFGNIETNFDLDKAPFGVVKVDPIGNGGAVVAPVPSRYNVAATIYFPAAGWTYPQADLPPMYESDGLWGTLSVVFFPYGNPMFQLAPGAVAERFNYDLFGGANFAGRPGQSALTPDNKYLFVPVSSDQPGRTGLEMIWAQPMYKDGAVIPFTSISDVAIVEPQLGLPFEKLAIVYLDIAHRATAGEDLINFYGEVTTYASVDTFRPDVRGMTLEVGAFKTTIPSGKFKKASDGSYVYNAWVDGVVYNAYVRPLGNYKYTVHLLMRNAPLPQIANPAQVRLSFGVLGGLQATIATIR